MNDMPGQGPAQDSGRDAGQSSGSDPRPGGKPDRAKPAPPAPSPATVGGSAAQVSAVAAAVTEFEEIDAGDVEATLTGGEALSATLTEALDEDSRRDGSR